MKKMGKMVLFLLVLALGIVIIDNVVFGLPGTSCHCYNFSNLEEDCVWLCSGFVWEEGEGTETCSNIMAWTGSAFCCDTFECCTPITYYCSDGHTQRQYNIEYCFNCLGYY